jgi:hypothetical protein
MCCAMLHKSTATHLKLRCKVIYFLKEKRDDGLIKIGYAKNDLKGRISDLQTGNSVPLKLLGVIPEGTRRDEHKLHKKFWHARSWITRGGTGEWFEPVDALMQYIASLPPFPPPLPVDTPPRPKRLR